MLWKKLLSNKRSDGRMIAMVVAVTMSGMVSGFIPGGGAGSLSIESWLVSEASAQTDILKFQRQLDLIQQENRIAIDPNVPVSQRALVEYGGFASFAFMAIDDSTGADHILRQSDLNMYARVNFDNVHEFFVRGRSTFRDFNSGHSFDGQDEDLVEPTLDRAYYRFDAARAVRVHEGRDPGGVFNVTLGRQLVVWGNGLALSLVMDGGVLTFGRGNLTADLLGARSRESQVDLDSSRPGFNGDMDRDFIGIKVNYMASPNTKLYAYGLWQDDDNGTVASSGTMYNYQSYYIGGGIEGTAGDNWLYGVEVVGEGGTSFSNTATAQTREDIQAWAVDARVDYLLLDQASTRFTLEVLVASGDDDRASSTSNTVGGNTSGTNDNAFNGFGLINTGLAFSPSASNLVMARLGVSTYPFRGHGILDRLQVGANGFLFGKYRNAAPINEGTDMTHTYLGSEVDVFFNWQITSDLSWSTRYGVFFPGADISADHDARHLLYTGVTLAF